KSPRRKGLGQANADPHLACRKQSEACRIDVRGPGSLIAADCGGTDGHIHSVVRRIIHHHQGHIAAWDEVGFPPCAHQGAVVRNAGLLHDGVCRHCQSEICCEVTATCEGWPCGIDPPCGGHACCLCRPLHLQPCGGVHGEHLPIGCSDWQIRCGAGAAHYQVTRVNCGVYHATRPTACRCNIHIDAVVYGVISDTDGDIRAGNQIHLGAGAHHCPILGIADALHCGVCHDSQSAVCREITTARESCASNDLPCGWHPACCCDVSRADDHITDAGIDAGHLGIQGHIGSQWPAASHASASQHLPGGRHCPGGSQGGPAHPLGLAYVSQQKGASGPDGQSAQCSPLPDNEVTCGLGRVCDSGRCQGLKTSPHIRDGSRHRVLMTGSDHIPGLHGGREGWSHREAMRRDFEPQNEAGGRRVPA